jgi:K+/H+ antiporter YhaU regulatory subunit KhtT
LDKLIQQVEHILQKQSRLENENEKLRDSLTKLKENEVKNIALINDYEQSIQNLSDRLEKLLTL